jgi:hypothetical protein
VLRSVDPHALKTARELAAAIVRKRQADTPMTRLTFSHRMARYAENRR